MYTIKQDKKWPFAMHLMINTEWLITIDRRAWSTRDTLETVNQHPLNVEQMTEQQKLVDLANKQESREQRGNR